MALFPLVSMSKNRKLDNAGKDYKSAVRVEQYKMSDNALYFLAFPGNKYIPFSSLDKVATVKAFVSAGCSCGSSVPMIYLKLYFDGTTCKELLFEKPAAIDKVLEKIGQARPEIEILKDQRPLV